MAIERIEFESEKKAIELPDGTVLDLPERTKAVHDKLQELDKKRNAMNEYDFLFENLSYLFGKDGFKKIAPEGNKTNLDYLSKVYRVSVGLIYDEKLAAEKEELDKKLEAVSPYVNKMAALPILKQ